MFRTKNRIQLSILILSVILFPFSLKSDTEVEIYSLRHWTHPTHTRIVLDVGEVREYNSHELKSPDRIYIDVFQTKLNPILHGKEYLVHNDYLDKIRIAQRTHSIVRAVMDVNLDFIKDYRIFYLTDPFRIVIDIFPVKSPEDATSDIPEQPESTKSGYSMIRQLGLGIQRIVIDPGHGGTDPGCIGATGLREKDVVLNVSKKLRKLLESNSNLEVVLTRESDIFMPVENRTVIANQKQGDIFISIHANAHRNKRLKGIETFFLNISHDPSVNEIAAKENATSQKSISKMRGIISQIVKNSKIIESRELAEKIQENLVCRLSEKFNDIKSLGVKGGPFWVLIGCEIPSVLVEISYMSNPGEEKNLKNDTYLQCIAEGIYKGIVNYINSLGKG